MRVNREQLVRHRLAVNNLTTRLPVGSIAAGARFGLQDTAPRDGLLGLHARVEGCRPDAWQHPDLIQTYSPRRAVYLLPRDDFGIFTLGQLPIDAERRRQLERDADAVCRELDGRERRGSGLVPHREVCASGRIALRWTTSALYVREVDRPAIDPDTARRELCRRHLQGFGPTTAACFSWWSGLSRADAAEVWQQLAADLIPVEIDGGRGWILADDEERLRAAPEPSGARLLVPSDLRLFGQDRTGRFVGPGQRPLCDLHDRFHPGGVMWDGRVVGSWGRRGGRVDIRVPQSLGGTARQAIEEEALGMPIPGAMMSAVINRM